MKRLLAALVLILGLGVFTAGQSASATPGDTVFSRQISSGHCTFDMEYGAGYAKIRINASSVDGDCAVEAVTNGSYPTGTTFVNSTTEGVWFTDTGGASAGEFQYEGNTGSCWFQVDLTADPNDGHTNGVVQSTDCI
jgi:hypothetical protein